MRSIYVEPDRLFETAGKVDQANNEYEQNYKAIYSEVDKLSNAWKGKDNTMFTNQIKSFENDFIQISIIMKQYADFLRNTGRAYREAQDEAYSDASRLAR